MKMGTVDFGGVTKEVCLAYVPDVTVGEFVLVHVGFALSRIDEAEAVEVFRILGSMGELVEMGVPRPPGAAAPLAPMLDSSADGPGSAPDRERVP
jgi:hydrogenase expression/formation protein HypC